MPSVSIYLDDDHVIRRLDISDYELTNDSP